MPQDTLSLHQRFHTLMTLWWKCIEQDKVKTAKRPAIEEEFDEIAFAIGATFFRTPPPKNDHSIYLPLAGTLVSRSTILRTPEYLASIDTTLRKQLIEQKIDPATYSEEFFRDLQPFEYASLPHRTKPASLITDQDVVAILKPLTSKDGYRPAMQHILFDAEVQHAVATDGRALVALPRTVTGPTYGIHRKTGEAMTDQYPNWRAVVPVNATVQSEPIALERLLVRLQGLLNLSRIYTWDSAIYGDVRGRLRIGPAFVVVFATGVLSRAVIALYKAGVQQVVLRASHPQSPILIADVEDERRLAVVMPVRHEDAHARGELLHVRAVRHVPDFTGIDVPQPPSTAKHR